MEEAKAGSGRNIAFVSREYGLFKGHKPFIIVNRAHFGETKLLIKKIRPGLKQVNKKKAPPGNY